MRIDKFLWSVRYYKTRTLATDACKSGKILLDGVALKPAFECKMGNEILVKQGALRYSFRIIGFPSSRVSAKLVKDYIMDITSEEDKKRNELLLEARKENAFYEYGKPSKKDRRDISRFKDF